MVDRTDLVTAGLALTAAVLALLLFAHGYLGPLREGWRLYAGAFGLFVALRALEWSARRVVAE